MKSPLGEKLQKRDLLVFIILVSGITNFLYHGFPLIQPEIMWERQYIESGKTSIHSIQPIDNGYILTGVLDAPGSYGHSILLIETDLNGKVKWKKTIGNEHDAQGYDCKITPDGGYIILGSARTTIPLSKTLYIVKTDSKGKTQWDHFYDEGWRSEGYSIEPVPGEGYVVAGVSKRNGNDMFLMKIDPFGEVLWVNYIGGPNYDNALSVKQAADGGFVFLGETQTDDGTLVYLVKVDPKGKVEWEKTFGDSGYNSGYSIQTCTEGGFILACESHSHGTDNSSIVLYRTDSMGELLWENSYTRAQMNRGVHVEEIPGVGFVVCGFSSAQSVGLNNVPYIFCTDYSGDEIWSETFSGEGLFWCVKPIGQGEFVVAGERTSNALFMKLKPKY